MHDYSRIPKHMRGALEAYVQRGQPPGDFLRAVLCNDLVGAVERADGINMERMYDWACTLYNELPSRPNCWGSPAAVEKWIQGGGLEGQARTQARKVSLADEQ